MGESHIYIGKAFTCSVLFLTIRNLRNFKFCHGKATVDAHGMFIISIPILALHTYTWRLSQRCPVYECMPQMCRECVVYKLIGVGL